MPVFQNKGKPMPRREIHGSELPVQCWRRSGSSSVLYSSFHAINTSLPINPFHAFPLFVLRSSTIPMKINLGVHYNFLQTCWVTLEGNLLTHLLKVIWSRPVLSLSHTFSQTYKIHYFLFIQTFFFFFFKRYFPKYNALNHLRLLPLKWES